MVFLCLWFLSLIGRKKYSGHLKIICFRWSQAKFLCHCICSSSRSSKSYTSVWQIVLEDKFPSNICGLVTFGKMRGSLFLQVLISGVKYAASLNRHPGFEIAVYFLSVQHNCSHPRVWKSGMTLPALRLMTGLDTVKNFSHFVLVVFLVCFFQSSKFLKYSKIFKVSLPLQDTI